ncbi:DUF2147 domain-containing protein [Aureimonas jatrophae]|jgi:uncharacterized protein (DUF2147 family)|uniref:Uncharacterized conserved protein, DUF2147 family n=1 Tax=Aureimonas jatrophae TaxID=1166073 RepID=A0A1H0CSB1_9HYPH|nr:DUF2147 domain-containing protein [Aureimonas jatrophae]MBB3949367.1 uncharacterized protein (DUF2147 family) [Aureimonas jatrophae]SDN60792.1 Uncharacterized conserved protein, DUF2147 family [Aureimonas jatrophae]
MTRILLAMAMTFGTASLASAEAILGEWRVSDGARVTYSPCPGGFCGRVESGRYKGKSVGRMSGAGPQYTGTVTDPSTDKTYDGRAEVAGDRLVLTGCVAKVFCRSQSWTR